MAHWIWTKTGGEVTSESRNNLVSSGRARAREFVSPEDFAKGVTAPRPASAPASRYRDKRTGGEVTAEARGELLSRGAKAYDFEPLDGDSAVSTTAPAAEPAPEPPAPPPPPPAGAAQYVDRRSGAVVSAAGMASLLAQGRAAPGDFAAADAPPPEPDSPPSEPPKPRRR